MNEIVEWYFDPRRYYPLGRDEPFIDIDIHVRLDSGHAYYSTGRMGERAYLTDGFLNSYLAFLLDEILTDLATPPDQPRC